MPPLRQICAKITHGSVNVGLTTLAKVESAYKPSDHQAGAYPGFHSMKRLGVFLLPPGWDVSPSHGYPQQQIRQYPFVHLGYERHC